MERSHSLSIATVHVSTLLQNESETLLHVETVEVGLLCVACMDTTSNQRLFYKTTKPPVHAMKSQ